MTDKFASHGERVAFQGEHGAYSEMATMQYFQNSNVVPMKSLREVFDALRKGEVDLGVVPIENSIEGSVNETYDLLLNSDALVSGEIYQRVRHCLIINKGESSNIRSVYSHPQALAQCRRYLQERNLTAVPAYDTAGAVKMIKKKKI
jgi:prephenate dehydratase